MQNPFAANTKNGKTFTAFGNNGTRIPNTVLLFTAFGVLIFAQHITN